MLGPDGFVRSLEAIRSSSRVTVAVFSPSRWPGSGWYLVRSGFVPLVLPGVALAAWQTRRRTLDAARHALLIVLIGVWVAWYGIASVGWPRYVLDAYMLGLLFAGQFAIKALHFAQARERRTWQRATAGLFVGAIALAGTIGVAQQIGRVIDTPDRSAQQLAAYLIDHVKDGEVIESWEWEIDVLADRTYHHPTNDWVDKYTAVIQLHEPLATAYDPMVYQPAYLIDGPFSKWTGLYKPILANDCCTKLATFGSYDVYAIKTDLIQ